MKQHFGLDISKKATHGVKQKSSVPESPKISEQNTQSKPETQSASSESANPLAGSSSGSAVSSSASEESSPAPSSSAVSTTAATLPNDKTQNMEIGQETSTLHSSNITLEKSNM